MESNSEHPLAKAIVSEAKRRNLDRLSATNFEALPGRGAKAFVEGKSVEIGGPRLLSEAKVTAPPGIEKLTSEWAADGKTVLHAVEEGRLLGAFAVEDEIRPESSEAVADLHPLGIRVAMITGDSKTVANSVARRIGIDEVAAEVLPADKAAAVKRFQAGGKVVAMVGDGVNDAPALATAAIADTLSTFMGDDLPDPARFLGVVDDLIAAAARATAGKQSRVAICGEWASILWAQGKADAAIQVEQLCNQLTKRYEMDILCGFIEQLSPRGRQASLPEDLQRKLSHYPVVNRELLPGCTHRIASRTERHANVDYGAFFGLRID